MNPTKVQARKVVLASLFVLTLVSIYRDRAKSGGQQGTYRVLWGVGVVGMFLSLLADFVPQIAGPFAALVALGSLTHGGDQAIAKVLATISPAASSTSSGPPPGPGSSSSSTTRTQTGPNTTTVVSGDTVTTQTGP